MASIIGAPVKRKEDPRLLTGQGAFVEDIQLPDILWANFLRSPHAHARIRNIDVSAAMAHPQVVTVLTGRDIHPRYGTYPIVAIPGVTGLTTYGSGHPAYYLIATEKVRYVGEVVAVVVTRDRYAARDAEDLVKVDYEVLSGVGDPEEALLPEAPRVHDERPNEALSWRRTTDNVVQAFEEAEVIIRERFVNQRIHGVPMEPRGGIARWDPKLAGLTLWASTQTPHDLKSQLIEVLNLPEETVRVVAPDVGGGFGPKAHGDPEYILLAAASIQLGAPVKWVATRSEEFVSMSHARGKVSYMEIAATKEGIVTAIRLRHIADLGAYPKGPEANLSISSAMMCVGAYHIPEVDLEVHAVYTHRTPEAPYRGAGRPEGTFLIERGIDLLARELGMDPAEVRRRNLVPPDAFPYTTAGGDVYDSGNYQASLDQALDLCNYSGLREEQDRLRTRGRYLGIGLCSWVKSGGIGPSSIDPGGSLYEWGRVRVDRNAKVTVYTGASPHGQGLETVFSQIAAEVLGVPVDDVKVLHGDTNVIAHGIGTFASRSLAVGGPAIQEAAQKILAKMLRIASDRMGLAQDELEFENGAFTPKGRAQPRLTVAEVAHAAYSLELRPAGMEYGLDESSFFQPADVTFNYGTYVAVVEVDPESGDVDVRDLFCADDQGVVVNPIIIDGQVHGGATQGLGQALYEQIVYDDSGQLITGSLLDYSMPTAQMVPSFVTARLETPSPVNPLGVKGMGEGPTVGMPPAIVNAVVDALEPLGVRHIEMPLTPERVRRAIEQA